MRVSLKDSTITIRDGASNTIVVKIGDGNVTYDETRTIEYLLDRGHIDQVREGDDVPVDVNLDFTWQLVTPGSGQSGGQVVSVEDALMGTGAASSWTSSDTDTCQPYAVDIEIAVAPSCGSRTKTITLPDFRVEKRSFDTKTGAVKASGKCNAKVATVVNV